MKGFKDFISQGNVVDLAVAVIIATAFGKIVTEFTEQILGGLIAAIVSVPSFDDLTLKIGDTAVNYGTTLTAAVNFLIVAAAIYFFVVVPMKKAGVIKDDEPSGPSEIDLLTDIRDSLKK